MYSSRSVGEGELMRIECLAYGHAHWGLKQIDEQVELRISLMEWG